MIKTLKTNGISGLKVHTVGEDGVTKIIDNSIESEQNTILQYEVYVNGKNKYDYVNGVYEIEHEI